MKNTGKLSLERLLAGSSAIAIVLAAKAELTRILSKQPGSLGGHSAGTYGLLLPARSADS